MLIIQGEHLKELGLQSIINIRASLNLGLSEVLKTAFPNTIPIIRPLLQKAEIQLQNWMAGFITGEGGFFIKVNKNKNKNKNKSRNKAGVAVQLVFQVFSTYTRSGIIEKFCKLF